MMMISGERLAEPVDRAGCEEAAAGGLLQGRETWLLRQGRQLMKIRSSTAA